MEKEEITIELLYRKLENRLTEEEVKHFEMWCRISIIRGIIGIYNLFMNYERMEGRIVQK